MASPSNPVVRVDGIPAISGQASINALLADTLVTANFEGPWVPWMFSKQTSVEVLGTFATLSCQLYTTNQLNPLNSYGITIAGTFTAADVITLTFTTPLGVILATYTVIGGNTATIAAAGLRDFINTSSSFAAQGIQASSAAGLLTVTWPTPPFTRPSAVSPLITVSGASSGSSTETVAVAVGSGGVVQGSAITGLGMTQLAITARWLKARITTLTGGNVSVIAQGIA